MSLFKAKLVEPLEGVLAHDFANVVRGLGEKVGVTAIALPAPNDVVINVSWLGEDEDEFRSLMKAFKTELPAALYKTRVARPTGDTYNNFGVAGAVGENASALGNNFGARLSNSSTARLSTAGLACLQYVADKYIEHRFPNYKAWFFSPTSEDQKAVFAELRALDLIKFMASGDQHVFTAAGKNWAVANGKSVAATAHAESDADDSSLR